MTADTSAAEAGLEAVLAALARCAEGLGTLTTVVRGSPHLRLQGAPAAAAGDQVPRGTGSRCSQQLHAALRAVRTPWQLSRQVHAAQAAYSFWRLRGLQDLCGHISWATVTEERLQALRVGCRQQWPAGGTALLAPACGGGMLRSSLGRHRNTWPAGAALVQPIQLAQPSQG